jgi:class 3 adenylate cyclase/streptogramin lyase
VRNRSGAGKRFLATVLFTDIVGSTDVATSLGDRRWRELLARHHAIIRRELKRFGGREIDTAGDGFFATFDAPANGIRCACAASEAVRQLGIDIRAGLHVGECETMGKKVGGIAVHTGARVLSAGGPGQVVVTATVKDLVAGSGVEFDDYGTRELKGIQGTWHLFLVSALDGVPRPGPMDERTAEERRSGIEPAALLRRRRGPIVAAGAALLAVAVSAALLLTRGGTVVPGVNTLAEIPVGADGFTRAIAVGDHPSGVAAGESSVWVINQGDGTAQRIDPDSASVAATKSTNGPPTGIAAGEGAAWITTGFGSAGGAGSTLYRFDPASDEVAKVSDIPSGTQAVAAGDGAIWVADEVNGQVLRIDPKVGSTGSPIDVGPQPSAIAVAPSGEHPVWAIDGLDSQLWKIDPATDKGQPFDISRPSGLAVSSAGDVWVTSSATNSVTRLDESGHTIATIKAGIPAGPVAITVAGNDVWVAGPSSHTVARIDASTNRVVQRLTVAGSPSGLATDADGNVWASIGPE